MLDNTPRFLFNKTTLYIKLSCSVRLHRGHGKLQHVDLLSEWLWSFHKVNTELHITFFVWGHTKLSFLLNYRDQGLFSMWNIMSHLYTLQVLLMDKKFSNFNVDETSGKQFWGYEFKYICVTWKVSAGISDMCVCSEDKKNKHHFPMKHTQYKTWHRGG